MNLKKLIETTMHFELSKEKQTILSLLDKHRDYVHDLSDFSGTLKYFPFLYVNQDRFSLICHVPLDNQMDLLFTKAREILFVVRHLFKEGKNIYVHIDNVFKPSKEEIWKHIHAAILSNDASTFLHYSNLLTQDFRKTPGIQ